MYGLACFGPITISSSLFHSNSAPLFNGRGGAIYTSSCNTTLVDSNLTSNTAYGGGALSSNNEAARTGLFLTVLIDCMCSGNTATMSDGGCLAADSVLLRLQGGSYSNNIAVKGEGGSVSEPSTLQPT